MPFILSREAGGYPWFPRLTGIWLADDQFAEGAGLSDLESGAMVNHHSFHLRVRDPLRAEDREGHVDVIMHAGLIGPDSDSGATGVRGDEYLAAGDVADLTAVRVYLIAPGVV